MMLEVLIATIGERINQVERVLLPPRPGVSYIISWQLSGKNPGALPGSLKRADVTVTELKGRGLSKNRNSALQLAEGDIALLADDDLIYRPEYFEAVKNAFSAPGAPDVACFKIATPAGELPYKDYADQPYLLNDEERHYISSLEIAFNTAAVKNKNITFDERFGLGSPLFSSGEEAVFIFDCIRAGLTVKYIPEYVAEHPAESNTKKLSVYSSERVFFKGGYDARRYGLKAVPAAFIDTLRLRTKLLGAGKSPFSYLKERLRGAKAILTG